MTHPTREEVSRQIDDLADHYGTKFPIPPEAIVLAVLVVLGAGCLIWLWVRG